MSLENETIDGGSYHSYDPNNIIDDTKKVANRQNLVGVKNPNRDKYLAAADEYLKTKGIH